MYRHRESMQSMHTGTLVGGRTGGYPHHGNNDEVDVTCKVEGPNGQTQMFNGVFKFKGAPVLGIELDHEALFMLEYGCPEGDITLFDFHGRVSKLDAWITTANGPLVVLNATFQSSLKVEEGDAIPVVGPQLRYQL